ncbi:MAG: hypothetical protein H5T73_03405 [Actinobacteria bacterium]|nr:hypothetical protein [Actinomycetota bacterium]
MTYLSSAMFAVGPFSVGMMLLLLMVLSRRLGHALETPPYHRLYLASLAFLLLPLPAVAVLLLTGASGLPEAEPQVNLLVKVLATFAPMAVAMTFALVATVKYWYWVWGELMGFRGKGGERSEGRR